MDGVNVVRTMVTIGQLGRQVGRQTDRESKWSKKERKDC
jgi:hypothetical protein